MDLFSCFITFIPIRRVCFIFGILANSIHDVLYAIAHIYIYLYISESENDIERYAINMQFMFENKYSILYRIHFTLSLRLDNALLVNNILSMYP